MNCEYYTKNCKTILTTGHHKLILCNETNPLSTTSNLPPNSGTTTYTEPSILATTVGPTTVAPTTYSPTTQAPIPAGTHTPTPSLRGYKTTTSSSYTTTTSVSVTKKKNNLESSTEPPTRYIYVKTNLTRQNDTEVVSSTLPDLTALWVCIGLLSAALIALVCKHYLCKKKKELKRRRSITPTNPPPVNRAQKNRNSWSQNTKAQDVLLHMNKDHNRRNIPKEHRKSMNALRQQIQSKRRKPPAVPRPVPRPVPTHTIDLSKVLPPADEARNKLTAITMRSLDKQRTEAGTVMGINDLAKSGGLQKLKEIRKGRRLNSINKTGKPDK